MLLRRFGAWTWLVGALLLIALLTLVSATSSSSARPLGVNNAGSSGGLALYLWLQRLGYVVHSTSALNPEPATRSSTLLLLDPQRDLTRQQIAALRPWIRRGGGAVIATDGAAWDTFRALGMQLAIAVPAQVSVTQPLLLAPPVSSLRGETGIVGERSPAPGEVASSAFGSALIRRKLGRGEISLLTAPELLDNSHISRRDNRKLALNLAGPPSSRLEFVELGPLPENSGGGALSWLTDTVWGAAILFILLVTLLYRLLGGWRLGPPLVPFNERRRPAVEYVISLADLLWRARKRVEVLRIYQRTLSQVLAERLGSNDPALLPPPLRGEVESLLQPPSSLTEEELLRRVNRILQCEEEVRRVRV